MRSSFAPKMKRLIITLLAALQITSFADIPLDEAKRNGMQETLQNYIKHNKVIADICVYEQEWIPPSKPFPKGQLIQRAVITHVHTGPWKVGQRIEYVHYIEDAPRYFGRFTSTVPGLLKTFFYDPDGSETNQEEVMKIEGDAHWGFGRVDDVFAQLFALELESNPKLKYKNEQDGGGQPATRPESK
jgi:hypothetical protein